MDYRLCFAMVLLQVGYAVMDVISKLAMESGMKPLVLLAYRQIFAVTAIVPVAFFVTFSKERTRPRITVPRFQLFLCSIMVTATQVFFVLGLEYLTATIASALNNLVPAVTLVLAVFGRLENVGIRTVGGLAKVIGTIVCVGGSTLLSFYHGRIIGITESSIHWKYAEKMNESSCNNGTNFLGPFLIMISCVAWAVGFIIQVRLGKDFLAAYTTAVMSFLTSIECTAIAFISEHRISAWSLSPNIRLIASIHGGIVCNALAFCLATWSIEKDGPLYVSMFSPLSLVIGAILNFALLHEKLFIGTLAGSVLIVAGLYTVLWGKDREIKHMKSTDVGIETKQDDQKGDSERQVKKTNDHPTKVEEKLDVSS